MQDKKYFLTIGTASCPYTIKQAQANQQNNIMTLFCDNQINENYHKSEIEDICYSFKKKEIKDSENQNFAGVPVNFTCSLPITADVLKNPNICKTTLGYDADFGKDTLFETLDKDKNGKLSRKEFENYILQHQKGKYDI